MSYAGRFNIDLTGCRDPVPNLPRIAVFCGEELTALEESLRLGEADGPEQRHPASDCTWG